MDFYTSIFNVARIARIIRIAEGPGKGSIWASFQLEGQEFMALDGGPAFHFSPAVSFFVHCGTPEEVDHLWKELSDGGKVLMELAAYPFSEKYGWVEDKFGLSWQLILASRKQKISPSLLFVGEQYGKAEEAMLFYTSLFKNSSIIQISRYEKEDEDREGKVKYAVFALNGQEFIAMESNLEHHFSFTPAISLYVSCKTQSEIDELWEKLAEGGNIQQCGWLQDKYGVSWQIEPAVLGEMLQDKDREKAKRVTRALNQMVKIDIAGLQRAYEQKV